MKVRTSFGHSWIELRMGLDEGYNTFWTQLDRVEDGIRWG